MLSPVRLSRLGLCCRARAPLAARGLCASSHSSPAIRITTDDESPFVKILTLSRPKSLNAMTVEMGEAVVAAIAELAADSSLRAVVVTGEGRAFSAGGDMGFLEKRKASDPSSNAAVMLDFYRRFLGIRSLPVPVVSCINGPAVGAGGSFAMASDIRVTCDSAKIGFTFVGLGLHPGMGCTHTVAAAAGGQAASRMLLTGDLVSGAEALKLGLVCASAPDAEAAMAEALGIYI